MCGRLFQTLPLARLIKIAQASCVKNPEHYSTSYNVCPTTYIPAIKASSLYASQHQQDGQDNDLQDQNNREMQFMTWGHKTNFNFIVNGRIEQMLQKRTFLKYINNRCVVIMEGYYQWNTKKQPFSFRPKGTDHFLIAALYTDEKEIIILTKEATKQLSVIHHRMPVILSHEQVNIWLNPIIKEKSQKCLMTFEDYKKQLDKTGLMRFWKKAPQVYGVDKQGKVTKVPEKQQIQQKMLQEQEVINSSTQKRAINQNRPNSHINNKSKMIQQSQQVQKIENKDQNHKSQKQKLFASLQMLEQGQQ